MKKRVLAMCLAVALVLTCATFASAAGAPVRFLASGMLSGPNAESGRQVRMAAEIGEWYINEVLGGFPSLGGRKVEIVVVDSTSDAAQAAAPFEQALSTGNFSVVVGNPNSSITLVNQPIAEAFQIPQITASSANIRISQGGFEYTFQLNATPGEVIPVQMSFLRYVAEQMGRKPEELRLGNIFADDAWGTDQGRNTRNLFSEAGFNIVFDQSYNIPTFTDATPLVTALMNAEVDVLLPSSYPSDLSLIFTAMGALGFKPLVLGGGAGMTWPSLFADLGPAVNGITSVDGWVWDQRGARESESWMVMNAEYERRFNEFIPGQAGPTLVSIMLAYDAIEKSGSDDPTVIRDTLRTMNEGNSEWFRVQLGNGSGFDPAQGNRNVNAGAVAMQWQNNRPTAVFPPDVAASRLLNPATMRPFGE